MFRQLPWRVVRNRWPPVEVLSRDQVEAIHAASLRLLRDIGMRIESAEARRCLKTAGAMVDDGAMMVRFDPAQVEAMLPLLPAEFTVLARDRAKSLRLGGDRIVFCSTTGPAFFHDLESGRRSSTYADMCNFIKLTQCANIIHHEGGSGMEPLDLPAASRYLDMMFAQCTLTDKSWHPCWKNTRARAFDVCEMARISQGLTRAEMERSSGVLTGITTNSPLVLDDAIAEGMMELARWNQPIGVAAFPLAGAMAPATLAGSLMQQNAEVLAGFMLIQTVRPGCPVLYGNFSTNVDLRSGAPAFGTPEHAKAAQAAAQMARRYGVPFRSSSTTGSNAVDAQAAYESMMSLWGTVMGHTNLLRHAAGWLEGGLGCSFEKFVLDVELAQMVTEYLEPIEVSEISLGFDAIHEVGPGGHFLGASDTMKRYETAFYQPILSDWRTYEAWHEDGARTATQRANGIWKELLASYEKPAIDPAVEEELAAYVARRKAEIAAGLEPMPA